MVLQALGLLCALGSVTLIARTAMSAAGWPLLFYYTLLGFAGTLAVFSVLSVPGVTAIALVVTGCVLGALVRGFRAPVLLMLGGAFAGLWGLVLAAQGAPFPVAVLIASVTVAGTCYLTGWREGFAPEKVLDEASLLVAAIGLVLAAGPTILAGWRTAEALKAVPLSDGGADSGLSVLVLAVGFVVFGGIYSWWKHR